MLLLVNIPYNMYNIYTYIYVICIYVYVYKYVYQYISIFSGLCFVLGKNSYERKIFANFEWNINRLTNYWVSLKINTPINIRMDILCTIYLYTIIYA